MRAPTTRSQQGFTLIELMITVGIGAILSSTFFTIMYWQNMQFYESLDNMDAHQNARAALNIMERYVRQTRYGLAQNTNAIGIVAIGRCYSSSNSTLSQSNCHQPSDDPNNDRMRLIFINNDQYFTQNANYSVAGPCNSATPGGSTASMLYTAGNANYSIPASNNYVLGGASAAAGSNVAAVGGLCSNGNWQNDLVTITGDSGTGSGCTHRYTFTMVDTGDSSVCAYSAAVGNMNSGWSFGQATVADFFIMQDPNIADPGTGGGVYELRLRTNPNLPLSSAYVVAYDITNLLIQYGFDTTFTPSPDRLVDTWCANPQTSQYGGAGDGTCDLRQDGAGAYLTQTQMYNRIMAVKLTVKVRTDEYRKNLPGGQNGYRYYTYSQTVSLRNNGVYQ